MRMRLQQNFSSLAARTVGAFLIASATVASIGLWTENPAIAATAAEKAIHARMPACKKKANAMHLSIDGRLNFMRDCLRS